jgi:hypothetical protein
MATNKRVIYPIFIECSNLTTDPYWKEQLELLAYNRFPQELRYDPTHSNFVLRVDKKPAEVIALPSEDEEGADKKIFSVTMSILKTRLNMRSTRDLQIQKDKLTDTLQKDTQDLDCGWKDIKPKCVKEQLIMAYLSELSLKHSLTPAEHKQLVAEVHLGLQFKSITTNDIKYSNGKILNITNLEFDKDTRRFVTPEPKPQSSKQEKVVVKNKFHTGIDRFLKSDNVRKSKLK